MDSISYSKTALDAIEKIIWGNPDVEVLSGGFTLTNDLKTTSTYVGAGAPVKVDFTTRVARLVKNATVQANASDSAVAIRVNKNHEFKVADILAKTVGGAAYAIDTIDTSNAAYDVLTIGTTLGVALTAGDVLYQSSTEGATAGAELYIANALIYSTCDVTGSNIIISGVIEAVEVREANLPYPLSSMNKTSLTSRFQFV